MSSSINKRSTTTAMIYTLTMHLGYKYKTMSCHLMLSKNGLNLFLKGPKEEESYLIHNILESGGKKKEEFESSSTEEGKTFVRTLIGAVQQNMRDVHCFPKFNKSNIVLTNTGEVRFKRIAVVPKNGPVKTVTYHSVRDLITELYGEQIPPDLQHLLDLLSNHGSENCKEKEVLYGLHPSIAMCLDASWIFLKLYEVLKFRVSDSQREQIYLQLPYLSEWREIAKSNELLNDTLTHRSDSYPEITREVTDHKRKVHEADKFLEFVRNGISHRLQRKIIVSAEEHEKILITSYPLLIPTLQAAIFDVLGPKEFAVPFNAPYTLERFY